MTEYRVTAKRWHCGWELHVEGVGVTQSKSLATAKREVRDYLELVVGNDEDPTITIVPALESTPGGGRA